MINGGDTIDSPGKLTMSTGSQVNAHGYSCESGNVSIARLKVELNMVNGTVVISVISIMLFQESHSKTRSAFKLLYSIINSYRFKVFH